MLKLKAGARVVSDIIAEPGAALRAIASAVITNLAEVSSAASIKDSVAIIFTALGIFGAEGLAAREIGRAHV